MNIKKYRPVFHSPIPRARWILVAVISLTLVLSLAARFVWLQGVQTDFLQEQGNARALRVVPIMTHRGVIQDRNAEPLALSSPVTSVWVLPKEVDLKDPNWANVARRLGFSKEAIAQKITQNPRKHFVYLKRHLFPSVEKELSKLGVRGLYFQREYRRFYPDGEVCAHILGFANIDEQGQEGLEMAYNKWLQGEQGQERVLKDRAGKEVEYIQRVRPVRPGQSVTLSIDRRLQYIAYKTLLGAVKKHNAQGGTVVLLDAHTGEILAMVNQPSYNPNIRQNVDKQRFRNRAVTDLFEPGSVFKSLSMANVLEQKVVPRNILIDTNPGKMSIGKYTVQDIHNNGVLDLEGVIKKSSNIGITKLTLKTPPDSLYQLLKKMGFGVATDSQFPGEVSGRLYQAQRWHPFILATLSFGYGVSVTALQLAQSYAVLANGGYKVPVSFLKVGDKQEKTQVLSTAAAKDVARMLTLNTLAGSGTRAQVEGYFVAGKTGTAKKVGRHGYEKKYLSVFAGFAPASNPRLVMVVIIDEPQGEYYGGLVAAPVFGKIMEGALRLLNVPLDRPDKDIPIWELPAA